MPAAGRVPGCSATAVPRARSEAHEASPQRTPLRSRRRLLRRLVLRASRSAAGAPWPGRRYRAPPHV
eukprot:scaffold14155_cov34-Phaeocystis_antarctica.AAC.1